MLEYQNIIFFYKSICPNWSEEVFVIKKVKTSVWWTYVISDLKAKKILERFTKKNCKKKKKEKKEKIKKSLELKK